MALIYRGRFGIFDEAPTSNAASDEVRRIGVIVGCIEWLPSPVPRRLQAQETALEQRRIPCLGLRAISPALDNFELANLFSFGASELESSHVGSWVAMALLYK